MSAYLFAILIMAGVFLCGYKIGNYLGWREGFRIARFLEWQRAQGTWARKTNGTERAQEPWDYTAAKR